MAPIAQCSAILPVSLSPGTGYSPSLGLNNGNGHVAQQEYPRSPAHQLRWLLAQGKLIVCPGVYDGISARIAVRSGHVAMYQTGAGTSASHIARADLGFIGLADMLHPAGVSAAVGGVAGDNAIQVDHATGQVKQCVPVVADADTGFGGVCQVARTVREYHRNGIACLHIEDQSMPKRCGHLDAKQIASMSEWVARIRAAVQAIRTLPCKPEDRIMLIARTDALASEGFNNAIARLEAAREAGADLGLLEGLTSDEEARAVVKHFEGWPIVVNAVTGGKSPHWNVLQLQALGFKMAIFSCAGILPATRAIQAAYTHLLDHGIGIEAPRSGASENTTTVDFAGVGAKGFRNFFVEMGLDDELYLDKIASGGSGLGRV